jgi:hypothetical protein
MATNNSTFALHNFANVLIFQTTEDVTLPDGDVIPKGYVNATQMCKANGKRIDKWKETKKTQEFLDEYEKELPCFGGSKYIISVEGQNDYSGTWTHLDIAMNLAQWVSAKFAVWAAINLKHIINNDFLALTPEAEKAQKQIQAIWEELRLAGIVKRNGFTDAIEVYLENNPVSVDYIKWIYHNCSDTLNKAIFGKTAKKLCEERQCDRNHLRDTHSAKDLDRISTIEKHAEKLILKFNTEPLQAIKEAIAFYE